MSSWIIGAVALVGAGLSAYSSYKTGKANQANTKASNAQAAEQHRIDVGYYKDRL